MTNSREKLAAVIRRSLAELNAHVVPRRPFLTEEPREPEAAREPRRPPGKTKTKRPSGGSDRVYGEPETDNQGRPHSKNGSSPEGERFQETTEPAASAPRSEELSEACVVQMDRLCRFFEESIEERCDHLRISRNQEGHTRLLLTRRGLLITADQIGKLVFFGPSDRGWEWAKDRGIEQRFPGGLAHEIRLRRTILGMRAGIEGARIERRGVYSAVQPDAVAHIGEGRFRLVVQVCVSTPVPYEFENLKRLAVDPAVSGVVFVAADPLGAGAMTQRLREAMHAQQEDSRTPSSAGRGCGLGKILITTPEAVTGEDFPWKKLLTAFGIREERT